MTFFRDFVVFLYESSYGYRYIIIVENETIFLNYLMLKLIQSKFKFKRYIKINNVNFDDQIS